MKENKAREDTVKTDKQVEEEYFEDFNKTQKLIIGILNRRPDFIPHEKSLEKTVKKEFKKRFDKQLSDAIYKHAFSNLIIKKEIGKKVMNIPLSDKEAKEKGYPAGALKRVPLVEITTKGVTKAIKQDLIKTAENFEKSIGEVKKEVEKKIEDTVTYMESIKTDVTATKKDIENIRKEFYGRILQIFGIFVTIFAFIIVGFTQIPILVGKELDFWTNLSNVSAVFFPLLVVLLILMGATAIIVKKN